MRSLLDTILVLIARSIAWILRTLPLPVSTHIMRCLIRFGLIIVPRHRRIAQQNLAQALPDLSATEREALVRASFDSLARVFVDFARFSILDERWMREHISYPKFAEIAELKARYRGRGILIATGHLGSFELLAHYGALRGNPLSFVVRNFQMPKLDAWWTKSREAYGNRVINRKGAYQMAMREIQQGRDVAFLMDQNITRRHAVFVPWFGRLAATSKTLAIVALRTEAPILVVAIRYTGADSYVIEAQECVCSDIYSDSTLSSSQKVYEITARVSGIYEAFIRRSPGEWFWMHRRWKTRPEGEIEDTYRD